MNKKTTNDEEGSILMAAALGFVACDTDKPTPDTRSDQYHRCATYSRHKATRIIVVANHATDCLRTSEVQIARVTTRQNQRITIIQHFLSKHHIATECNKAVRGGDIEALPHRYHYCRLATINEYIVKSELCLAQIALVLNQNSVFFNKVQNTNF